MEVDEGLLRQLAVFCVLRNIDRLQKLTNNSLDGSLFFCCSMSFLPMLHLYWFYVDQCSRVLLFVGCVGDAVYPYSLNVAVESSDMFETVLIGRPSLNVAVEPSDMLETRVGQPAITQPTISNHHQPTSSHPTATQQPPSHQATANH